MLGTHPCLMMDLCNPPAASVLKGDHDLLFVEQCCIASWELADKPQQAYELPPNKLAMNIPRRLMLKRQCETKKRPQITAHGSFKPRQRQEPMDFIAIEGNIQRQFQAPQPWFQALALEMESVWQPVWALPLALGLAGGGNCRKDEAQRNLFANLALGISQTQGQRPKLQ